MSSLPIDAVEDRTNDPEVAQDTGAEVDEVECDACKSTAQMMPAAHTDGCTSLLFLSERYGLNKHYNSVSDDGK